VIIFGFHDDIAVAGGRRYLTVIDKICQKSTNYVIDAVTPRR
jgi:hypothetical protein